MAKREVILDLSGDTYERGAVLLSLLAFPEEEASENLILSCFHSLCALFIRAQLRHGFARAYTKEPVKLAYACWEAERIERDLGRLEKRLEHRMLAGKMVMPFLQHAQTGTVPPEIRRLSIQQMARMVLPESGQSEPKNIVSRIWRPSRPVMHLAAATTFLSQALERCGQGPLTVPRILSDSAVIDLILRNAEEMVPLLEKSHARVEVDSLIRLRAA